MGEFDNKWCTVIYRHLITGKRDSSSVNRENMFKNIV